MSYFWPDGYPLAVQADHEGLPLCLAWDWCPGLHSIWMIADEWSVDDLWWVERKSRDYYKVVTESGQALVIFQDVLTQNWFVQWMFD
ncbi:MAG: hypothetical protein R3E39_08425 [Anaerolineae bacterium]